MSHTREQKVKLLQDCLDLPQLTDRERSNCRHLAHAFATGTETIIGMMPGAQSEITQLFNKLRAILNVPQP